MTSRFLHRDKRHQKQPAPRWHRNFNGPIPNRWLQLLIFNIALSERKMPLVVAENRNSVRKTCVQNTVLKALLWNMWIYVGGHLGADCFLHQSCWSVRPPVMLPNNVSRLIFLKYNSKLIKDIHWNGCLNWVVVQLFAMFVTDVRIVLVNYS